MQAVLSAKFQRPELLERLLGTGSAFLLEHNRWRGRDATWSDNADGSGLNLVGAATHATAGGEAGAQQVQRVATASGGRGWQDCKGFASENHECHSP